MGTKIKIFKMIPSPIQPHIQIKMKKHTLFLKLPHLLLLFMSCPFGSLGTVDRFGLRTVYEV